MTLADRLLKGYERDITLKFKGKEYPLWVLMERLLKITDKDGNCVDFLLNYQQIQLYIQMCIQRRNGKPIRQNVLKARQIGYSTFIAGVFFLSAMYTPNLKVGIVADVEKHAKDIFAKYEYFYKHLDDNNPNRAEIEDYEKHNKGKIHQLSYKPILKASRGQQFLATEYGNSILEVIVAGVGAGRGSTYHLLHLSECAFFDNLKVTTNGLLECVSSKNKKSMIFLETTANGFNEYKDRWDKDVLGKSSYHAQFTAWYTNPDYVDDEYQEYFDRTGLEKPLPLMEEWLYEKQKTYKISNAQMMWYLTKYLDKGDKSETLQEYPFTTTDAFVTSGACVFDAETVARRKDEVLVEFQNVKQGQFTYTQKFSQDGGLIELVDDSWNDYRNGLIRIYEEPIEGHPYVGICDPNNGGKDDIAIQIIDNYTLKQVACMNSNEIKLDECAYQFYLLGKMYNWALLSNEMNTGKLVMDYLVKMHYPKLYVSQNLGVDDYRQGINQQYGHNTNRGNRQFMIDSFKIAFRQNPKMINDYTTLCQMETFQKVVHTTKSTGKQTYKDEASGNNHDDLITAFMAFFQVRNQQSAVPFETGTYDRKKFNSIEEVEFWYEEKLRKQSQNQSRLERATGIRF